MKQILPLMICGVLTFGAIAVTEPTPEVASTSNSATYAFAAFTPTSNAVLVIFAAITGTATTTATVTGGLTWTQKDAITYNTSDRLYVLWAKTGSSPGSSTFTVDVTGDNGTGAVIGIFQFTDADIVTSDPIRQVATGTGTSGTHTINFASAKSTTNGYAAAVGGPANTLTEFHNGGWTETYDAGYNTPTSGSSGAFRAGGETSTIISATGANVAYGMAGVEVYVTGAGPVPPAQGYIRGRVK